VLAVAANLSNGNEVSQLAEQVIRELSGLDIVVFNSGHPAAGRLDELSDADWYAAFDLLLMSAVRIIRLVVPVMKARGGGDIVFIGSRVAREPAPDLPLSTVMRLGLTGLAKLLATELAPHNIRINVVAPGYFDTSGNRRRIDAVTDAEGLPRVEAEAQLASHIPIGRFGRAEELAALVLFLVTGKGGFLTGTTITMDGGASRSLF
jgi:3-oxoacyl-[acyl-carrier protein] reductase